MDKKKQLVKNTIIIFLGKVCTQLISFFLLPLYTACLSKQEYGIVDLIQSYGTLLVPVITLELEMSIFRFMIDSRGKEQETKKLLSNNFFILTLSLIVFSVLYVIATTWIINVPFRWIVLINIIVCVLSGNFLQLARGFGKTIDFSISCILTGITTVASNLILICIFKMGAEGMIISMALANFVCSLYLFIRLKLYKYFNFKLVNKKLIKEMNKYSIPLIPNSISWWIINVSDRSIISFTLGAAANGLYAISNKFPTILSSLVGIFNLSWSESAALHIDSPDRDEFFSDITNTVIKLFTCLGVGMIACMPFIFPIMIDSKYDEAYAYIPYLVLGTVFNVAVCLYNQVYLAKKLSKQVATTAIVGAVINIMINILFIKKIGLYAASFSTAIAYFIMMIQRHLGLKKYVNIKIEKGLVIKTIMIFAMTILIYYQSDILPKVLCLIVVCIYSFILNKKILTETFQSIRNRVKQNNN